MDILIQTPSTFQFKRTALSHGWSGLLPFELDCENWLLTRVLATGGARPVTVEIQTTHDGLQVTCRERLSEKAADNVVRQVKHILRLDDDMSCFYALVEGEQQFSWITASGAGRLIRSPTVYEDLIKTICTTNCSWAATQKMVTSLVRTLGAKSKDGRQSFPTPSEMALQSEDFYRSEIRAGYRAGYLKQVAEQVASGDLYVEHWLHSSLPTSELKKEIKKVKGVGEYAADNLLKLLGRYDGLALDSWLRAKFAQTHNRGRKANDKKIERHYARFKEWRGLAIWCDMTRDWIEQD
jgi:3-methyladenine DNA glycosylase/8-oxoguanine DNA glycosylase